MSTGAKEQQPSIGRAALLGLVAVLLAAAYFGLRGPGRERQPAKQAARTEYGPPAPAVSVRPVEEVVESETAQQRQAPLPNHLLPPGVLPEAQAAPPSEAEMPTCPEKQPKQDSGCQIPAAASLHCSYGQDSDAVNCDCDGTSDFGPRWNCTSAKDASKITECPKSQPASASPCFIPGHTCFFGEAEAARVCECEGGRQAWRCISHAEWAGERL